MSKALKRYAILAGIRTVSFYIALALVQYFFDGKVAWLANLLPAAAIAILLTYVHARLLYLRKLQRSRAKGRAKG